MLLNFEAVMALYTYLHLQDADIFGGDSDAEIPPNDPLPTNKA